MRLALFFCGFTFLVLFTAILIKRVSLERARDELQSLTAEIQDRQTILHQVPVIDKNG